MDSTLYQLRVVGAKALIRKLIKRITSKSRRRKTRARDFAYPTYAETVPQDFAIRDGIINFEEVLHALVDRKEYFDQAQNTSCKFFSHEYNFLSDRFIQRNRTDVPDHPVKAFVNESNRDESERIFKLINSDYHLINWQADHASGLEWDSRTHMSEISYGKNSADIKVPWELGRFQHVLPYLLLHFESEGMDAVASEFRNQFLDFVAFNPPRFGVQWKCTMDVALRAFSLLASRDALAQSGEPLTGEVSEIFTRSIFEHGEHIRKNLEWNEGARGNHYLADILGLIAIGIYSTGETARRWLSFAAKELDKEILYQFNSDGTNFEASTNYHVFALEMVLWALYLLRNSDEKARITKESFSRIRKALEFTRVISTRDGLIPQIGDNDGGRVFPLASSVLDKRPVIKLYSILTGDSSACEYFKMVVPEEKLSYYSELKTDFASYGNSICGKVVAFDDFGLYVFANEHYLATFRCGSVGQRGKGGHAHCDQLALTLAVDGKEIISDSGTYVYTSNPSVRNRFRSSGVHSTIVVEGKEQFPFGEKTSDDLFWIKDNRLYTDIEISGQCKIEASHKGYSKRVSRKIEFFEKRIHVEDSTESGDFESRLVLTPESQAKQNDSGNVSIIYDSTVLMLKCKHGYVNILTDNISKTYGVIDATSIISVNSKTGVCVFDLTL